ncbi:ABC transporter ATP-binding protein [Alicyclobacillus ferrooxydans]|uniref:Multidrug ABC transporter ATP-binding protein n=1 Tax=Alicyclobacillus ferrooxydans TaxID=471514 RepID=A0A0P9CVI1_9BACL|nr:ABC transporter transmembrane domain-containing protein [Alicyclobacillus ferrooxydans]KPV43708.1 multidrug ABC transporter ATP-binding protein [Alicyclobacillus ferrooxydans]
MRVFLDLMWYFKAHKWRYLSGILVLIAISVIMLIPPQIVGMLVDRVSHKTLTTALLIRYGVVILTIAVILYILRYIWRILLFGAAVRLATQLRNQLYDHFTRMSPEFYHERRIGDLMAHSTNDIQAVEQTAMQGIMTFVDSIATGVAVIITMAVSLDWKLTIIALLPLPLVAWSSSYYGSLMHHRFGKAQAAFSDLNDRVQENISGVRVIKAFGQEQVEEVNFRHLSQDVVDKNMAVAKIDALFDPTISLVTGISFFLTIAVGAVFVVHGHLTLGQLTAFTMYLGQLVWPMLAFGWLFNIVERGHASYDRIRVLLATPAAITDHSDAVDAVPEGQIEFHMDAFQYPSQAAPLLKDLHLSVEAGQTLGIVGRTGSGKTTLFKLLLREFDAAEGSIRIGGRPITKYKLNSLRKGMSYVPQDHFLFSASIAENIAFAKPTASFEEIQMAAKIAAIHDDIVRFPAGYGTIVGERGVTLSGGQKQRISIARAILVDADILILDDCLSAVDAKTEQAILESLKANRSARTTLIATHRLSTIEHADYIIVLDDGCIVEQGTHEQLVLQNGWYKDMYQRQQLESLVEQGGTAG